jgi:phage tail-like protein
VLALDRSAPQLGTVTGAPLQTGPVDTPAPGILRSCQVNPNPPQMTARYQLPPTETFVALTAVNQQFALLSWNTNSAANTASYMRLFDFNTGPSIASTLSGVLWPYSVAWLGDLKLAVLATGLNEALVFDLSESGTALIPTGATYVLANNNGGPFGHSFGLPPYYAAGKKLATPVPVNGGTAALTLPSLTSGRHPIRALYNGDANNPASASAVLFQTVSEAPGTVSISSSLDPAPVGQMVTFSVHVLPATATGNVQFLDGATSLGSAALSGGVATLAISTLAAGMHSISAAYGGDNSNPAATAMLVQTITQVALGVTVSSSQNPSTVGQAITLTAQISPATATGNVQFLDGAQLLPLLPLSLNSMAGYGSTDPRSPRVIDSGKAQTVWHRLFIEAILPPRTSILVWLTASDSPFGISSPTASWYPHAFGDADMTALPQQTPEGVWLSIPSEVSFANPLLGVDPVPNRQGLFMVLVQRVGCVVRNLSGRFLGVRVELYGDRRSTPELAGLRVWASRFSYVNNYLPQLYRENKFSPAADQSGPSTRRDFFERFVDIFEAQLTRIEDCIANSYLLTRPETTPDAALDWLGGWVGLNSAGYPQDRRRARLRASAKLHRNRGTVKGITESLNIATNGLCSRGAVIVVEDFRLRHIFATILGADLDIQNDPLLPGFSGSSNSFVGDTLFLGDPRDQAEILALFSAPESGAEQAAVQQFYDSLANRMTVFIHNQVETVDVNLVTRIVRYEKPAHVAATIRMATQPFMIGLASLLGVDSYLAPEPSRDPVVIGSSQIGRYNQVIQAPSLDPRLET